MALKSYGVLKGSVVATRRGSKANAHYQVHVVDDHDDWRIAVNVESAQAPSEVAYLVISQFTHPMLPQLSALPRGFTTLGRSPSSGALDYIRLNLFEQTDMVPLPYEASGPNNDLNDVVDGLLVPLRGSETAAVYAFGERWGPEDVKDKVFGFRPGNGVHDIHMNQGNDGRFQRDNGVWQDGGLLVARSDGSWGALFLAFQSQSWHTDDTTGDRIGAPVGGGGHPAPDGDQGAGDGVVRIIAALVNPTGPAPEAERLTLLNTSAAAVDLTGWQIANAAKERGPLNGALAAGGTLTVASPVALSNQGGIITLLDDAGLKIHGVAYTRAQASREGWTIAF